MGENDGKPTEKWYDTYPESLRSLEVFKNSPDEDTMVKRLGDQQTYVSQALRIPGEDAGDEDWKAFHEKLTTKVPNLMPTPNLDDKESVSSTLYTLGAPKEADKYSIPELEVDEGMTANTDIVDKFKEAAFKHKLLPSQFEGILKDIHEDSVNTERQRIADFKQDRESLTKTWGATHDVNLNSISVFMTKTKAPDALLDVAKFGDAATLEWLHRITKAVNSDKVSAASDRNLETPAPMTPSEAQAKISEIRNNKKHPYNLMSDPGHKAAKVRMRQLYVYADPENAEKAARP